MVSWDKAFCSRGKANEIISVTQDLVRMFCIYGADSVLSLWFKCSPVPASAFPVLSVGIASPGLQASEGWNRIPILFPTLPTISGNLLTTLCENLEIKHSAVVTNPQTQRLHFKKWLVCLSGLFFFSYQVGWFCPAVKTEKCTKESSKRTFTFCEVLLVLPGGQGCGEMLNLPALKFFAEDQECVSTTDSPVRFLLAQVHPARPKCWTSPLAKSCRSGQELLGQGDFSSPSNGIWRLFLPQRPRQQQQHQANPPGSERSLSSSSCQAWLLSAVSGASGCQRQDFISASLRPYRKPKMFIYVSYCLAKSVCALKISGSLKADPWLSRVGNLFGILKGVKCIYCYKQQCFCQLLLLLHKVFVYETFLSMVLHPQINPSHYIFAKLLH